jgi:hypothetical protein
METATPADGTTPPIARGDLGTSRLKGCSREGYTSCGQGESGAVIAPAKLRASYCRSLGAAKGSPQYIDCRLRVMEAQERRKAAIASSITSCTSTNTGSSIR